MRRDGCRERGRVHPVDLLVLVLAMGLAALAYAYLFRRSPVPRPVDPLLGAQITVALRADRPWKREFPRRGDAVRIEDYLAADVTDVRDEGAERVATLLVRGRETQDPEALTLFRSGVRRGTELRLSTPTDEVKVEVLDVRPAGASR